MAAADLASDRLRGRHAGHAGPVAPLLDRAGGRLQPRRWRRRGFPPIWRRLLPRGALWNMYAHDHICRPRVRSRRRGFRVRVIAVGGARHTRLYIMTRGAKPCPWVFPGECDRLTGLPGVPRRPEMTAERFVHDRSRRNRLRVYRHGRPARWRPDCRIAFLGRIDSNSSPAFGSGWGGGAALLSHPRWAKPCPGAPMAVRARLGAGWWRNRTPPHS